MPTIELACVDMAGTTVSDDGVVQRAFTIAGGRPAGSAGLETPDRPCLSPADACRGHPWPDMIQLAARTFSVTDPAAVAVAVDTPSDVQASLAAEAALVAGVLTGSGTRTQLESAGVTHMLTGIAELPTRLLPATSWAWWVVDPAARGAGAGAGCMCSP